MVYVSCPNAAQSLPRDSELGSAMRRSKPIKSQKVIIEVSNPDALKRGSLIVLDVEDQEAALKIAHKIAAATGRPVRVRDEDMAEIQTIPATKLQ